MDDEPKETEEALAECEETVEELKEENAQLRESAQTFGDLAERLSAQQRSARLKRREPVTRTPSESLHEKG